jgi:hypothetical protein
MKPTGAKQKETNQRRGCVRLDEPKTILAILTEMKPYRTHNWIWTIILFLALPGTIGFYDWLKHFFVLFSKVVNLVFHLLLYSATNRQSYRALNEHTFRHKFHICYIKSSRPLVTSFLFLSSNICWSWLRILRLYNYWCHQNSFYPTRLYWHSSMNKFRWTILFNLPLMFIY